MDYKAITLDYKWDTAVYSFDVGASRLMTPSAILRMQQEVGGLHLDGTRAELEALIANNVAFLSIQSRVKITRLPKISEKYRLTTWPRNTQRARFYRCYSAVDSNGAALFDGVTSFVYVNFETHKILRPSEFENIGIPSNEHRTGCCPDPEKPKIPDEMEISSIKRYVRWSDTDWNGHLNNTVYADIMMDYIPSELIELSLKEFTLTFISECRIDEVLNISTKVEEIEAEPEAEGGKKFWVLGEVERDEGLVRCFVGEMIFSSVENADKAADLSGFKS